MVFHTRFRDKILSDRFCESPASVGRDDVDDYACEFGGNTFLFLQTGMNVDEAMMQGVELTLDYALSPVAGLSASYTYTETEQKSGEFRGKPLNKQPRHMANALLDWRAGNQLDLWFQANYRSRTSDYMGRTAIMDGTPGYGFVDLGLVYRLTDTVDVSAGVYNIANKEVTDSDYEVVLDGRRVNLGVNITF